MFWRRGATIEPTKYLPFGHDRDHSGADVTDYKFTDQEKDTETGLYNYDARMYDPVIGRFISPDPVELNYYNPQNLNRYSYCLNNPLIFIDPTGMWTDPIESPQYRGYYGEHWLPDKSKFGLNRKYDTKTKKYTRYHQGVDLYAKSGTKTVAALGGKIVRVGEIKGHGTVIDIEATIDKEKRYLRYSHLSETSVKEGDTVDEGAEIGKTGKSGSTAKNLKSHEEHLHFEINKVKDPTTGKKGHEQRLDPENYMKIKEASKEDQKKE